MPWWCCWQWLAASCWWELCCSLPGSWSSLFMTDENFHASRAHAHVPDTRWWGCSLLPVNYSFVIVYCLPGFIIKCFLFSISHTSSGLQSSVQTARHYAFRRDRFQHVREVLQRRAPLIPQHRARQDRSNKQIPGGRGRGGLHALILLHDARQITKWYELDCVWGRILWPFYLYREDSSPPLWSDVTFFFFFMCVFHWQQWQSVQEQRSVNSLTLFRERKRERE